MSNAFPGKTVLITGATGFIGRHLANALRERNVEIRAVVRDVSRVSVLWPDDSVAGITCDLSQAGNLDDACDGADTIFHLASHSDTPDGPKAAREPKGLALDRQDLHYKTTVDGTRVLLDAAVRAGVKRFIFFSSVKVFGERGAVCVDESSDPEPLTPYGRAKFVAEKLVLDAGRRHALHVCVLRLPLVYGSGVKGNLDRMIEATAHAGFPPLPETGNKRSLVHGEDVVEAALLAAEDPRANGQIYIVTDDRAYSTRQIYSLICHALGKQVPRWSMPASAFRTVATVGDLVSRVGRRPFPLNSDALQKLLGSAWYSSEKIRKELGYRPSRTLESALGEMVREYRKQRRP